MGSESIQTPSISAGSAAPASGKYGGFGSEDIAKLGYGKEGQFNQAYDPYTKAQSATSHITHQVNNTKPSSKKDEPNKKKDKKKIVKLKTNGNLILNCKLHILTNEH